jgi:phage/plasmid primase-like uncharacterized protein
MSARQLNAAEIARALGGTREGRSWRCECPVHRGKSLIVTPGRNGKVLFRCFAGCEQKDVVAALRDLGLFGRASNDQDRERGRQLAETAIAAEAERLRYRIDRARLLYARAVPAAGTPAEIYLRARGITLSVPECLRFLPHCPHRNGGYYPALVAPVVGVTGHLIGLAKTFLRPDGSGKADLPKEEQREFCGPVAGGAVRLEMPRAGEELAICEGLETAASCMQLFGLAAWAALSAPGIAALELPPSVRAVLICADHDQNAVGLEAALEAKERWAREGRVVRVRWPREVGADFNDILRAGG